MLRQLFRKRTLAVAGAAILLVGAAATVGAAGGASHITGSAEDVLDALQITHRTHKIDICHVPFDNPDNAHTISIAESAWDEHLAHDDTLGACADDGSPGPPDGVGPSDKVVVCHIPPDNTDNAHTISIPESVLQEHLDHGDIVGACDDDGSPGPPDGVGPSDKVVVCHIPSDNTDSTHTISVPESALEEHLAHDDTLGACDDHGSPGPPDGVGPSDKVVVCHIPSDNTDNAHTISIPESVLQEHLDHGDTLGACGESSLPDGGP